MLCLSKRNDLVLAQWKKAWQVDLYNLNFQKAKSVGTASKI